MMCSTARYDFVMRLPMTAPSVCLGVRCEGAALVEIDYLPAEAIEQPAQTGFARRAQEQLSRYFQDGHIPFDLPLAVRGTPFQLRVWQALQLIPAGQVLTYGELAKRLNTSSRAVGNACRANPVPVVIPCHRVVAKAGLGGYSGRLGGVEMDIKRWLLLHEGYL